MSDSICHTVHRAHHVLVNNRNAFLQSVIFILRAQIAARDDIETQLPVHSGFRGTHEWLQKFAAKMGMSADQYIESHLFFTQISGLEFFFQCCVAAVLRAHPKKLGSTQFTLAQFLEAETKEELVERAADMYLNKLMYKKPREYLTEMCDVLSIPSIHIEPLWPLFVEVKARRDLGTHNNWRCNEIYLRKLAEVGLVSEFKPGESVVPRDEKYFTEASKILSDIGNHICKEMTAVYGSGGEICRAEELP